MHVHHLANKKIDLVIEWELVHDSKFDVAEGFTDKRDRDFRWLDRGQTGFLELVHVSPGCPSSEDDYIHHALGRGAQHEFARLIYEAVSMGALRDRDDGPGWFGAGRSKPHRRQKIRRSA